MSSGNHRTFYGAVTGTGAALDVRTVGFRPKEVELLNTDGLATLKWTDSMKDDEGLKEITTGTKSFLASNGVIPLSDGFTMGADADLNAAGEVVHFVARG